MNRILVLSCVVCFLVGCNRDAQNTDAPVSDSGVHKASTKVETGPDGLTAEQRNVSTRLKEDNTPGAIKHLYVISPYSGQVIIYSTVKGKVSSSGKRLTPLTVYANQQYISQYGWSNSGPIIELGGEKYRTTEVLQDDGTYGSSDPYIYWWDSKGIYHQHFMTGGQIVHISTQPLAVKNVIINMETNKD